VELVHKTGAVVSGISEGDFAKVTNLFHQKYCGSRYSFGYPACPGLEDRAKIFKFPQPEKSIGVQLTEGAHLEAEQSARAILVRHPQAKNL
jgi:5-methyltetrahydrofolate--homocysteine methyltransferase